MMKNFLTRVIFTAMLGMVCYAGAADPSEDCFRERQQTPRKGSFLAFVSEYVDLNPMVQRNPSFDLRKKLVDNGISPAQKQQVSNFLKIQRVKINTAIAGMENSRDIGVNPCTSPFELIPYTQHWSLLVEMDLIAVEYSVKFSNRAKGLQRLESLLRCEKFYLANSGLGMIHFHTADRAVRQTFSVIKRLGLSPEEKAGIAKLFPTQEDYLTAYEKAVRQELALSLPILRKYPKKCVEKGVTKILEIDEKLVYAVAKMDPRRLDELCGKRLNLALDNFRNGNIIKTLPAPEGVSSQESQLLKTLIIWPNLAVKNFYERETWFSGK